MAILNRIRYLLAGPAVGKTLLFKGRRGLQRSARGFVRQHKFALQAWTRPAGPVSWFLYYGPVWQSQWTARASLIESSDEDRKRKLIPMLSISTKTRSCFGLAVRAIAALVLAFPLLKCDPIEESIRRWGEESRRDRARALQEEDLQRWQNDLEISRAEAEKLNEDIHELVQESELQGRLSWRIARAYMNRGRYDLAGQHFQAAIENERLDEDQVSLTDFERALPYFEEAIKRNPLDPDLLFDAGLCYANASRAAGWELNRFETAVLLFETVNRLEPTITRSRYQLALLYGKTENPEVRDLDRSVALLQEIIRFKEDDIPAHFALGHMLVARGQRGDLESARDVYADTIEILENLDRAGGLRGPLSMNPDYQQATENYETLDQCLRSDNDSPCQIL